MKRINTYKVAFSEKLTSFVNENYSRMSNKQMAEAFGTSIGTIRKHCHGLGLLRMELEYWTNEKVDYLKANYIEIGDKELAEIFQQKWPKKKGWTLKHIEKKRKYLKLQRTRIELLAIKKRNVTKGCWQHMATWKKRHAHKEGTVKMWGKKDRDYKFLVIKVDGRFVHYAQWLYVKHFGPFPEGFIIGFKDRDNMNVVPENLEAISRAEHARRNRTHRLKLPDEYRALYKILNQLNNTIKFKQNEQNK